MVGFAILNIGCRIFVDVASLHSVIVGVCVVTVVGDHALLV